MSDAYVHVLLDSLAAPGGQDQKKPIHAQRNTKAGE
jgi:hypothetical protein